MSFKTKNLLGFVHGAFFVYFMGVYLYFTFSIFWQIDSSPNFDIRQGIKLFWLFPSLFFCAFLLCLSKVILDFKTQDVTEKVEGVLWSGLILFGACLLFLHFLGLRNGVLSKIYSDELKHVTGVVSVQDIDGQIQTFKIGTVTMKTRADLSPWNFQSGCPSQCKIKDGMVLQMSYFEDEIFILKEK